MKNQILTALELKVIEAISKVDNPEYFFSDEILESCDLNPKQARGAMASLVKKGIIDINNDFDGLVSIFETDYFPESFVSKL